MFCARCGQQIPESSEICPLCGRDASVKLAAPPGVVPEAAAAVALAPSETAPLRPIRKDLQGVGGWLLLFCIGLVVLSPLVTLVLVFNRADTDVLGMVLGFVRAAVGVVAGVFLWNVRPVAFTLLWIYFGIVALLSVLGFVGFVMNAEQATPQDMIVSIRALIYALAWFLYFKKSERVRATFGRNL
jgi:hypothetical protein